VSQQKLAPIGAMRNSSPTLEVESILARLDKKEILFFIYYIPPKYKINI
jgi:hypothetical protein